MNDSSLCDFSPSGCLVALAIPTWTAVRSSARSEADVLSKIRNWRRCAEETCQRGGAPISIWMAFAEKVQALQRAEYKAVTDAYGQGQELDLRLLIGLTEQEELAMRAVDGAVDGKVETWAEPYILSGLEWVLFRSLLGLNFNQCTALTGLGPHQNSQSSSTSFGRLWMRIRITPNTD